MFGVLYYGKKNNRLCSQEWLSVIGNMTCQGSLLVRASPWILILLCCDRAGVMVRSLGNVHDRAIRDVSKGTG